MVSFMVHVMDILRVTVEGFIKVLGFGFKIYCLVFRFSVLVFWALGLGSGLNKGLGL